MSPATVRGARAGQEFVGDTTLVVTNCWCGITHAIPRSLDEQARMKRGAGARAVYCPLGHEWHYLGKTEAERLQEQLEDERRRSGRLAAERDQAQAAVTVHKRRATRFRNDRERLKTRAAAAVCPCCNRHFKQLAAHLKAKHPDFRPEAPS